MRIRGSVGEKRIHLGQCRRQTGEIERNAPKPCFSSCFRRRRKPFLLQSRQHKCIDRVLAIRFPLSALRNRWTLRRRECPMRSPFGALLHPLLQRLNLLCCQRAIRIGRRHLVVRIGRGDSLHQFAGAEVARNDYRIVRAQRACESL